LPPSISRAVGEVGGVPDTRRDINATDTAASLGNSGGIWMAHPSPMVAKSFIEETSHAFGEGGLKWEDIDAILCITSRQNVGPHGTVQYISWSAFITRGTLYIKVPNLSNLQQNVFKESVVSVLELAEDMLGCQNIVVCLEKSREDLSNLLRAFLFVGFEVIHPSVFNLGKQFVLVGQSLVF